MKNSVDRLGVEMAKNRIEELEDRTENSPSMSNREKIGKKNEQKPRPV